jgi:hypothetical protein
MNIYYDCSGLLLPFAEVASGCSLCAFSSLHNGALSKLSMSSAGFRGAKGTTASGIHIKMGAPTSKGAPTQVSQQA